MVWHQRVGILCLGFGLACGPSGVAEPEVDSETEGTGTGSTGTPPSTTNPTASSATVTAGSMSGSATTTEGTDDTGPMMTSVGPDSDTTPPPETTDECPFGTEGCLCDVGATCDEGLDCNDEGICVAPPACSPLDTDPHGDEPTAIGVDMLACGDGNDLGVIGTVEGPETDWYTFFGDDSFGCPEQPTAIITAAEDLAVCVYLECEGGTLNNVACDGASMAATSPEGREGCCGTLGAQITGYDCFGGFSGKNADIWISVGSDAEVCVDYGLEYSF